jgi:hypothetical protein
MSRGSGSVVLGLSLALLAGLSAEALPHRSVSDAPYPTSIARSADDGQLIALQPQYGNHRTGNKYNNGRSGKWGNRKTGNRVSGNRYTNGRHKYGNDVSGNKYTNEEHKYGNDTSGNRQWRDHPH